MSILIFTDPHDGLRRTANTTPASSIKLREAVHEQLARVIEMPADHRICGGDWFDTYSNDEEVIAKTLPLLAKVDLINSGNHDLINIKGKMGSLGLAKEILSDLEGAKCDIPMNDVGKSDFFVNTYFTGSVEHTFYTIPHCSTQELFESALDKAEKEATASKASKGGKYYLLLHCNYNSNFAQARQTDLNLTKFRTSELIESFDYIILGHEHIPRDDFQGRLIVLGNTHPTSFADISDKRIMTITDSGVKFTDIWYKSHNYLEVDWKNIEESYDQQFIRIVGAAKPEDIRDISKAAKVLERNCPNLFALKIDVEFEGITHTDFSKTEQTQTMSQRIEAVLEESDKDLLSIWKEFA